MEAAARTMEEDTLAPEWERIGLLAHILAGSRQGRQASPGELERLRTLQHQVEAYRLQEGGWRAVAPAGLSPIEFDVLACVVAPEAEPRLGWLFQTLQSGAATPYPTPALLQELLAMAPEETPLLYGALTESSPLRISGLIEVEGGDPFQPVKPSPGVTARLLGRPAVTGDLPGAVLVKTPARWDDLVLPPDRVAMLREFLLWITHKATVVGE
ncbi:MAG: ATPase, partial [Desulfuromonadales bacterium]